MTLYEQKRVEKRLILNLVNRIEDVTETMFHEYMPQLDTELNTTEDLSRLKAIRVELAQHHYELTMDRPHFCDS